MLTLKINAQNLDSAGAVLPRPLDGGDASELSEQ